MESKNNTKELEKQIDLLSNKLRNMVQYRNSLESRENIYQEVLDSVPAFIFWKDKNNNMLGFNIAYEKAVNIPREELLSKTGFDLFPDAEKYWIDDLEVINTGIPKLNIVEDVIIPPNKKIWFKTDKTPLKDEKGDIIGVIGVSIDITELKNTQDELYQTNNDLTRTQEELKQLNADLDLKVKLRTKELQDANENLKRVNKDLDNFVYIASHDLRHPVLNMEGILARLNKPDKSNEETATLLNYMNVSVEKLKKTIDELAHIIQVQNNIDEEIENISLQEVFEEVMFSLKEVIYEYPELNYNLDFESCPVIRFSRKNLRSIFFNMISNSIKYQSAQNNPYISIRCRNTGDRFLLEFKDNGTGIKEEHQAGIFDMIRRFNDNVQGSGLGLYIVKRIVDNYNGEIIVNSIPEKETKFDILLPNIL